MSSDHMHHWLETCLVGRRMCRECGITVTFDHREWADEFSVGQMRVDIGRREAQPQLTAEEWEQVLASIGVTRTVLSSREQIDRADALAEKIRAAQSGH